MIRYRYVFYYHKNVWLTIHKLLIACIHSSIRVRVHKRKLLFTKLQTILMSLRQSIAQRPSEKAFRDGQRKKDWFTLHPTSYFFFWLLTLLTTAVINSQRGLPYCSQFTTWLIRQPAALQYICCQNLRVLVNVCGSCSRHRRRKGAVAPPPPLADKGGKRYQMPPPISQT